MNNLCRNMFILNSNKPHLLTLPDAAFWICNNALLFIPQVSTEECVQGEKKGRLRRGKVRKGKTWIRRGASDRRCECFNLLIGVNCWSKQEVGGSLEVEKKVVLLPLLLNSCSGDSRRSSSGYSDRNRIVVAIAVEFLRYLALLVCYSSLITVNWGRIMELKERSYSCFFSPVEVKFIVLLKINK